MILAIDKIKKALNEHPTGLTVEQVAQICGLTYNTAYVKLRDLFNYQMVVKVELKDKVLYRLSEHDIAVASPDKHPRRSLSE